MIVDQPLPKGDAFESNLHSYTPALQLCSSWLCVTMFDHSQRPSSATLTLVLLCCSALVHDPCQRSRLAVVQQGGFALSHWGLRGDVPAQHSTARHSMRHALGHHGSWVQSEALTYTYVWHCAMSPLLGHPTAAGCAGNVH